MLSEVGSECGFSSVDTKFKVVVCLQVHRDFYSQVVALRHCRLRVGRKAGKGEPPLTIWDVSSAKLH